MSALPDSSSLIKHETTFLLLSYETGRHVNEYISKQCYTSRKMMLWTQRGKLPRKFELDLQSWMELHQQMQDEAWEDYSRQKSSRNQHMAMRKGETVLCPCEKVLVVKENSFRCWIEHRPTTTQVGQVWQGPGRWSWSS